MTNNNHGAGRPSIKPKRITSTVNAASGKVLQKLADESGVKLATFCSHILERYALQGSHEVMSNDILISRLENNLDQHNTKFAERFGDILLRIAHEVTASRRYDLIEGQEKYGKEENDQLRERSWQLAVKSLRGHVNRVQGEQKKDEEKSASGEEYSR